MNPSRFLITLFVLIFIVPNLLAQNVSNRAIRLVEKSKQARKDRDFAKAIELLEKAIEIDQSYGEPYLALAGIYQLYQQQEKVLLYYNRYSEVTPAEKINPKLWERIAELNFRFGEYKEAAQAINHIQSPDSVLKTSIDFSISETENEEFIFLENLPDAINAYQLQYFPVITVDENTIIYTKRNSNSPSSDEDIVISKKLNGEWIPSQSISTLINSEYNEGACSISADGRMLVFTSCEGRPSFGNCDLYVSYKVGHNWSKPENMGKEINSSYWDSQPALSADGRIIYFSSNRSGGYGKRDIWMSRFIGETWTEPENLGSKINTSGDEITPYIHVNSKTLFFASDGHVGLGGFDLYLSERIDSVWALPTNLGYPINTNNDEISVIINSKGTHGYYALETSNNGVVSKSEIVKFRFPGDSLMSHHSGYVTGRVIDQNTREYLKADIEMVNLADSSDVNKVQSDSVTGGYFLVLTVDNEYGVFVDKPGYLFEDFTFMVKESSILSPDTVDILLTEIKPGAKLILENIYFDFDDYHLHSKSISELKQIVSYLKSNPNLVFVIEGHTDGVGSEEYNLVLSENRVKAVYDYLARQGVSKSRMKYVGFGSSQPLINSESAKDQEKNRRIQFKVLSND